MSQKDRDQHLSPKGRTFYSDYIEASWWGRRVLGLNTLFIP